jgi:hypothetical protein
VPAAVHVQLVAAALQAVPLLAVKAAIAAACWPVAEKCQQPGYCIGHSQLVATCLHVLGSVLQPASLP